MPCACPGKLVMRSTVITCPPAPMRSITSTCRPCFAASVAADRPAAPAPMMARSVVIKCASSAPVVHGHRRLVPRAVHLPVAVGLAARDHHVDVFFLEDPDRRVVRDVQVLRLGRLAEGGARVDV